MDEHRPRATPTDFAYKYRRFESPEGRAFREQAGGTIANGYTTPGQARRIADALAVGPGDRVLDLGAGRGWPGGLVAARTGASLVTVDLPIEALKQGRGWLDEASGGRAGVVCADGRALPIGDGLFDAVCHADVLC